MSENEIRSKDGNTLIIVDPKRSDLRARRKQGFEVVDMKSMPSLEGRPILVKMHRGSWRNKSRIEEALEAEEFERMGSAIIAERK